MSILELYENKTTPYMVLIQDREKREEFRQYLTEHELYCVTWNDEYAGVLVNLELSRFGLIYKACKHGCVDKRDYSMQEFIDEVFVPWLEGRQCPYSRR